MKIAVIAAETLPFSKSGGLADYVYSLSNALSASGHEVDVITPDYGTSAAADGDSYDINGKTFAVTSQKTENWTALKLSNSEFFGRPEMYGYDDDNRRFAYFAAASAALVAARSYDIVHCNDWQSGFVPLLLKQKRVTARSVYTIHNLQFQGNSAPSIMDDIGIDHSNFFIDGIEFYGNASSMKAGIVYSDRIVTVSPTYSREIQTEKYGFGMEGIIRKHNDKLKGILNGIDYRMWNPSTDGLLPSNYSSGMMGGKAACKSALQRTFSLPQVKRPLIVSIGRLWEQKGIDILIDALDDIDGGFQFIILGTGDRKLMHLIQEKAASNLNLRAVLRYDEELAHRMYAGSDIFVMPSRFEPCGLSQMISMRYGTVPVVRRTGGLADTVADFDPDTAEGNGFVFEDENGEQLAYALTRAIQTFSTPEVWSSLVSNCMAKNYSWEASAVEYERLYAEMLQDAKVS